MCLIRYLLSSSLFAGSLLFIYNPLLVNNSVLSGEEIFRVTCLSVISYSLIETFYIQHKINCLNKRIIYKE